MSVLVESNKYAQFLDLLFLTLVINFPPMQLTM